MSISIAASLRPLGNRRFSSSKMGLLSIRIASPTSNCQLRVALPLVALGRPYSTRPDTNGEKHNKDAVKVKVVAKPDEGFGRFLSRNLAGGLRLLGQVFKPSVLRGEFRKAPARFTFFMTGLVLMSLVCVVALVQFTRMFYNPYFSKYPDPVANTLRRAVYYSDYRPDPNLAHKFYNKALQESNELGLYPFSDLVLGIRIRATQWMEKSGNYKLAVQNLEALLKDCNKWLEIFDQQLADGQITRDGWRIKPSQDGKPKPGSTPETVDMHTNWSMDSARDSIPPENLWRARERILAKTAQISSKLGAICASEHYLDPEKSHAYLLSSVEIIIKESARRRQEGLRPGEAEWMTPSEFGAAFESLGDDYQRKSGYHLSIPLYFHALRLCDSPCHRAVIMNNLSASFAQHPIYSPTIADGDVMTPEGLKTVLDSSMPNTRKDCLEAALNWARNAYQHGKDVKGAERTSECDQACAVALCNWGDVAALLGKAELAKKKFEQAIQMSQKLGFEPGIQQAQEGLAKLSTNSTTPA